MNILLSTDNNYVMPTGVLMHSISTYNNSVTYHILVNGTVDKVHKASLERIAEHYGNTINFYCLPDELTSKMPVGRKDQPQHITLAAYNRLFVAEFLPKDIHKIIYLDSDMLVRKSLEELWNYDLEGRAIGVVIDMHAGRHCSDKRLPYDMQKYSYFNSGMLLINVDYWRKYKMIDSFMQCIDQHSIVLKLHDQDVLNICLHDNIKWLPVTYNFQSCFLEKYNKPGRFGKFEEEIIQTMHDPAIVHYTAEDKPWKIEVFHTYTKDWRKFFFMSEWKHNKLDGEESKTFKQKIRNYLVRHCLYTPASIYYQF